MPQYVTDRKLWLNADKSRVVEDGDPEAAFLLASRGKEIPDDVARRYGLNGAKQVRRPPTDKAAPQVPNKALDPGANKGAPADADGPGANDGAGGEAGGDAATHDTLAEAIGDAKVAEALRAAGLGTPEAIRDAPDEELRKVEGVGPARLERLRAFAASASAD